MPLSCGKKGALPGVSNAPTPDDRWPHDRRPDPCQHGAEGDYGPTIILEHTPVAGLKFHTLYGHLDRDSLKGLKPGTAFMAGEKIAQLGTRRENGGWSPHLHFQIILDIGSAKGDYPGVAKRSEQDKWLAICPDPAKLLGRA